jgi:hypothetical protein
MASQLAIGGGAFFFDRRSLRERFHVLSTWHRRACSWKRRSDAWIVSRVTGSMLVGCLASLRVIRKSVVRHTPLQKANTNRTADPPVSENQRPPPFEPHDCSAGGCVRGVMGYSHTPWGV